MEARELGAIEIRAVACGAFAAALAIIEQHGR